MLTIIGISFVVIATLNLMNVVFHLETDIKTPGQLITQFLVAAWTGFGGIYILKLQGVFQG